jgi:hypothetical protein
MGLGLFVDNYYFVAKINVTLQKPTIGMISRFSFADISVSIHKVGNFVNNY